MQPCFKKHRLSSIDFIQIGWVIIGLSSLRQLLSTRTFDTLQTTRERKKKRTHVTAFVSTSFSPPWKFICNGNSACVAYILFFSEVRLFQARVVDFPLSEWPSSLKKKDWESIRRSRFSLTRLLLHSFGTGSRGRLVAFRFDLISAPAAPTVCYSVGRSCVSIIIISAFWPVY